MLDMGFGPDIDDIVKDPSMTPKFRRQTLLFSATFPDKIQEAAATYLKDDYLFLKVGVVGSACKDVRQTVFECEKFQKREKLVDILNGSQEGSTGITEKTLVFVETKQNADFLALYLSSDVSVTKSVVPICIALIFFIIFLNFSSKQLQSMGIDFKANVKKL